jgi:tetratricopeptide (TPR) repeat protein
MAFLFGLETGVAANLVSKAIEALVGLVSVDRWKQADELTRLFWLLEGAFGDELPSFKHQQLARSWGSDEAFMAVYQQLSAGADPASEQRALADAIEPHLAPTGNHRPRELAERVAAFLPYLLAEAKQGNERVVYELRQSRNLAEAHHEQTLSRLHRIEAAVTPEAAAFPSEAARKAEAPVLPPAGAAIWNVPAVSGRFVGREALLDVLAERLSAGEAAALTQVQALHGLGGVGKTRVAVEFARSHRDDYDVVWWVRSEDSVTILADYAALADALALPERGERGQETRVAAVKGWLEANGRWLLVFDNAPGPEALHRLIPDAEHGHVLITSRRQGGWRGIADPCLVDVLQRGESVAFLKQRSGDQDTDAAGLIAEALGDLPLALEQAGAYVDSMQISLAGYQHRLRSHAPTLFERGRPPDYERTIATTWELAFAELEQDPGCAAVLFCCAFLAPERIPRELFASETLADGMFVGSDGQLALDDVVKRMLAFSLVAGDESHVSMSMHRLVQCVVRNRLGDRCQHWLSICERLLAEKFPADGEDHRVWPICERLISHALAVTDRATEAGAETPQTATLLFDVARYLRGRAEFATAMVLFTRALEIFDAAYGPEHPQVATALVGLGMVLRELGDLEGAREHQQRALRIFEAAYGPEHRQVAITLGNLGDVLRELGDLESAREHQQRGLQIKERTYGPEHPQVAVTLGSLGIVLRELGDLEGAREHQQRTLRICEAAYGSEHREVAIALGNLGNVLRELGDLEGARDHQEHALQIGRAHV